ncbi:C-type lectin lectoxin-Thr1-like [Pseudonaja textilis]|uniref:C-type lectin lectoxin-Thr1-like n=1 Tax=Pseudonaja textilis TaxID=8673 RepID=UPI000EA8B0B2|nr:C-type lectin lectoxin-Thr1-like [Pseudonaja textilis]
MGRFSFLSLALLVVVLSLNGAKGCCPHEWFSRSAFCYKVFEEAKTWEEAEKYCKKYQHGCHLASLDSKEESEDMAIHISQKFNVNIWIGLSRPSHVGPFLLLTSFRVSSFKL